MRGRGLVAVTKSRQSDYPQEDRREYPDLRQGHHRAAGGRSV